MMQVRELLELIRCHLDSGTLVDMSEVKLSHAADQGKQGEVAGMSATEDELCIFYTD